ncbi:hypothetical protein A7K93_02580 [Candidatus Methylacidiphilum fumarolicum]|uniref:Uncharacterized protein n=2 Tax=Candidatus Methylacidiphilum fumarolicum TaxID=591154 RepID=I0JVJ4_METFB|nr:hypothetical protein [Candidatus Methylacidiphilum fumarolicum]MBW6414840.1 hypothetical protein [Candidatus Methylacidiphilum fumarolicum]TFE68276.1 hypothetical protein A7K73_00625 [Candidatus Methylacidiphilum fumarolicum]TFE73504.1 hypothetical protein A7K72_06265 [Candidatus Methylacidiphilum fumarolicum]TFE75033.1 hypothetical protein A7K93_02580 [Candidatus Methylacidiphilum fumarolicum]TFE76581.1 hypothetical protein A7D33_09585 [Candidatus Methylacidiphilum fumarolicum]
MKNRIKDFYSNGTLERGALKEKQEKIDIEFLDELELPAKNETKENLEEDPSPLTIDLGLGKPIVIPSNKKKINGVILFLFLLFPLLFLSLPLLGVYIFSSFSGGHLCWHQKTGFLSGLLLSLLIFGVFLISLIKKN